MLIDFVSFYKLISCLSDVPLINHIPLQFPSPYVYYSTLAVCTFRFVLLICRALQTNAFDTASFSRFRLIACGIIVVCVRPINYLQYDLSQNLMTIVHTPSWIRVSCGLYNNYNNY